MSSELKLKFLFGYHDGVSVEMSLPESMSVLQVKRKLVEAWPEQGVSKASTAGIRLLCMGRMLEDSKTLAESKVPKYDHPTPIIVSLLPMGKSYSEAKPVPKEVDGTAKEGGCCILM
jgi:hypothetical protein